MDIDLSPIDTAAAVVPESVKQNSYASTDEDVDELNSHYSEILDRSISTVPNYREKFSLNPFSLNNDSNTNSPIRPRILSTEYSQITFDSGVDINSEQKVYQPNTTLTIDEQSSEETIDQNDLFALSDDSLTESPENHLLSTSLNQTEQEIFYSVKSEINNENSLYSGYELETITDEEDDEYHYRRCKQNDSNELILTSKPVIPSSPPLSPSSPPPRPSPPPPPASYIPPQYEFKLPTFGEWIDRVFTSFLTEANQDQPQLNASSRSSSIDSTHGSRSTVNTSSSSQVTTVIENPNSKLAQTPDDDNNNDDDDEHSLNGKSLPHLKERERESNIRRRRKKVHSRGHSCTYQG